VIVTLTLNPGLDLTYTLTEPTICAVEVHRAATATIEASGKGVNVSRILQRNGFRTSAVLPLGGSTGHHLAELLAFEGVEQYSIPQSVATRINTTITTRNGDTAKVNGPGASLSRTELDALVELVGAALDGDGDGDGDGDPKAGADQHWLAVCGSLPPGVDPAVVGAFVSLAHAHGARCAIDASGPALRAAITAGADLLAPNRFELGEVDPQAATAGTTEELAAVAAGIAHRTGAALLVSLGADGALFTNGDLVLHGHGPALTPVNTAGAGDALLAGWLGGDLPPIQRMGQAIRWSRAACLAATTVATAPADPPRADDGIVVDTLSGLLPERTTS